MRGQPNAARRSKHPNDALRGNNRGLDQDAPLCGAQGRQPRLHQIERHDEGGGGNLRHHDALGNFANPDKIATPDNLKFSEKLRTLFIGEDSNTHVNNFLWAYNVDTKKLSRVLSTPAGAESTGLHAVDEINGWTYIMSSFQHLGDWESPLRDIVKPTLDPLVRANCKDRFGAAVGYVTGDATSVKLAKG